MPSDTSIVAQALPSLTGLPAQVTSLTAKVDQILAILGGVTPPQITLPALLLSSTSATVGTAFTSTVTNKTSGSTLSLSGAGAVGLSVSGASITGTPTTAGTINLTETLAGATNSPRTTSAAITVGAATGQPTATGPGTASTAAGQGYEVKQLRGFTAAPTISPNDGRYVVGAKAADATNGDYYPVVVGSTARTAGTINYTVTGPTGSGATGSVSFSVTTTDAAANLNTIASRTFINLEMPNYFTPTWPFLNMLMAADVWGADSGTLTTDADGNITSSGSVGRAGFNFPRQYAAANTTPRRYVIRWEGNANAMAGATAIGKNGSADWENITRESYRIVFDFKAGVTDTQIHPAGEFRNARLVPLAYENLYESGGVFLPEFKTWLTGWGGARFMVWGLTIGGGYSQASQVRRSPRSLLQGRCISVDTMVLLCNEMRALTGKPFDMIWQCPYLFMPEPTNLAPYSSSNPAPLNTVLNFVTTEVETIVAYIRDNLHPDNFFMPGDSNEYDFNDGFPDYQLAYASGQKMYVEGTSLGSQATFKGTRAKALFGAMLATFGNTPANAARFVGRLECQAGSLGNLPQIEAGFKRAGGKDWREVGIKRLGGAPYISAAMQGYEGAANRAVWLGWARGGASGLTSAIQNLIDGSGTTGPIGLTLQGYYSDVAAGYAAATARGLTEEFYEWNYHSYVTAYNSGTDRNDMLDFVARICADSRTKTLVFDPALDFALAKGIAVGCYNDMQAGPAETGFWGVAPDYFTSTPRLAAFRRAQTQSLTVLPALSVTIDGKSTMDAGVADFVQLKVLGGADGYQLSFNSLPTGLSYNVGQQRIVSSASTAIGTFALTGTLTDRAGQTLAVNVTVKVATAVKKRAFWVELFPRSDGNTDQYQWFEFILIENGSRIPSTGATFGSGANPTRNNSGDPNQQAAALFDGVASAQSAAYPPGNTPNPMAGIIYPDVHRPEAFNLIISGELHVRFKLRMGDPSELNTTGGTVIYDGTQSDYNASGGGTVTNIVYS